MGKYKTLLITVSLFVLAAPASPEIKYSPKQTPSIFEKKPSPFKFSHEKWNDMRRAVEEGRTPGEKVVVSTVQVNLPELPPPAEGAVVELPYETRLSISGRKLIGVDLKAINYDTEKSGRSNRIDFNMKQELQVRIKGQVGRKIMVNVDFDDTVPDKRDISVVYRGDPDEVVQEAAFGDITLSLPNTEFVGYSKPAFGIKLNTKYKKWRGYFIASQAKGVPETKRFTGSTRLVRPGQGGVPDIFDTSYISKKYYKLAIGTDTIKPGTEEIRIDRRDPTKIQNSLFIYYSTGTNLTPTASGYFDLLLVGNDYNVDYSRGIIIFRNVLQDNAIIAVNYQRTDGTWLNTGLAAKSTYYNLKMIKDEINTPGITTELKNYYILPNTQIIRDNGRGNFVLRIVQNSASLDVPADIAGKTVPVYPATINVDFEAGIFWLTDANGGPYQPFPDAVYARTPATSGYKFFIEYRYTTKTYNLRAGIIPQSEQVILDTVLLKRDIDYFIDYDAGILTFLKEDKIMETSVLDVTYEYAPFAGLGSNVGESFIGMRNEFSVTDNVFLGVSYMQNFPPLPQNVPDIRSVPQDLAVYEADTRITGLNLGPFSAGFGGEYALSVRNMNTKGNAMIENMENIKQEDSPSLFMDSWKYGWTQTLYYAYGNDKNRNPEMTKGSVYWDNIDLPSTDIYNRTMSKGEKVSVLNLNYNLASATEAAIMQNLSRVGLDFSKKLYLEVRLKLLTPGTANGQLKIELGKFSEDIDHSAVFKKEDKKVPGTLSEGEDTGWTYVNPDGSLAQIGANNGQVDSEDVSGDGIFDTYDQVVDGANGTFTIDLNSEIQNKVTSDNNGWVYIRKPITVTNALAWNYVKEMRLTVNAPGQSGTLQIASLSIVGNKWENLNPGPLVVSAVSNFDDDDYKKNAFIDKRSGDYENIYGQQLIETGTTRKEQSLQLQFTNVATSVPFVATKVAYSRPIDLTTHKRIRFFVFPTAMNGNTITLRAGHDDGNYFEFSSTITSQWQDIWQMIELRQDENPATGSPDRWVNISADYIGGTTSKIGNPSLSNITYFKVLLSTSPSQSGKIWIDELYATDPVKREGHAFKGYTDLSLPGWGAGGISYKQLDGKFETFIQPIKNQELFEKSAYLNFTKISFSPQNFSARYSETKTPDLNKAGDLVSYLQQDENIATSFSYNTGLYLSQWPKLPQLGGGYSITTSSISNRPQNIFRTDITETYNGNAGWDLNWLKFTGFDLFDSVIPGNVSVSGSEIITQIKPWETYVSTINPNSREVSNNYSIRAPWTMLWQRLSINPSYSQTYVKEDKYLSLLSVTSLRPDLSYDKSRSQTAGTSISLRLLNWFNPSANYNIQTNETYNYLNILDNEKISKLKTVSRNGAGDISAGLGMANILPSFTPTRSFNLNGSYRIEDGDTYENLYSSYTTFEKIWIRDLLDETKMTRLYKKDTILSTARWNLFEGVPFPKRLEPIKRLSTTANFTESRAFNNVTGTKSGSYVLAWPDLLFSFTDIEKIFGVETVVSDTNINYKTYNKYDLSERITESNTHEPQAESNVQNQNIDLSLNLFRNYSITLAGGTSLNKNYDYIQKKTTSLSKSLDYSAQVGFEYFKIKFTPRYSFRDDKAWPGDPDIDFNLIEKPTQDLTTQTAGLQLYADTSFPGGLPIPLISKRLDLTNRFIFTVNYTFTYKDTEKGDIAHNKITQNSANLNADYEVSSNLRVRVSAGYDRFENRKNQDDNYTSYSASGQLTIIF